jgi:hypothetical protein
MTDENERRNWSNADTKGESIFALFFSMLTHTVPLGRTVPCSPSQSLHGNDNYHSSSDSSNHRIEVTIKCIQTHAQNKC